MFTEDVKRVREQRKGRGGAEEGRRDKGMKVERRGGDAQNRRRKRSFQRTTHRWFLAALT